MLAFYLSQRFFGGPRKSVKIAADKFGYSVSLVLSYLLLLLPSIFGTDNLEAIQGQFDE